MMKNNNKFLSCAVLTILWFFSAFSYASNQVQSIRIWPSPDNTRVVLDLAAAPQYKSFSLDNPDRLVIDLSNITGSASLPAVDGDSTLIKTIRSSGDDSSMRIVLDLNRTVKPTVFALTPTAPYGHRILLSLLMPGMAVKIPVRLAPAVFMKKT